ncbi:hypothetical protein [Cyanobacterium aponinum]|uniref:Uncharacterized protein n=1 Tax=Cyanobacterium aponinum 0216 TaxID=2676140 RepID=A0A844GP82_9CHRO|nr:hypothetical protein [Cyanobacterium aponinum]MTF38287.1 hypothetical protein [Cyanobacterium aponinum 0216]
MKEALKKFVNSLSKSNRNQHLSPLADECRKNLFSQDFIAPELFCLKAIQMILLWLVSIKDI